MLSESHCFALHVTTLLHPHRRTDDYLSTTDTSLMHRIKKVLRLYEGDSVILFDAVHHAYARIYKVSERSVEFTIEKIAVTEVLKPLVTWWLPLLKREAFEEALYVLAALGVQDIQPLQTKKTLRTWGSSKDFDRATALMIAACEQAKQFVVPRLHQVKDLGDLDSSAHDLKILFDPTGEKFTKILAQSSRAKSIIVCSGPEGDFIAEEKSVLRSQGFVSCSLTPTILKAEHAVTVGMGMLRSW